jgi:hypothetical protein
VEQGKSNIMQKREYELMNPGELEKRGFKVIVALGGWSAGTGAHRVEWLKTHEKKDTIWYN